MSHSSWFLSSGLHLLEIFVIVVDLQLECAKLSHTLVDTELQKKLQSSTSFGIFI